ncbi:MAG: ATP-binding protein, partial [Planctomycetia bacterium]|nr:ATP-binding protein [Planctomycetia bacterium]
MTSRENQIVLYYLNNLIANTTSEELDKKVCSWFDDNSQELIGYNISDQWERRNNFYRHCSQEEAPLPEQNVRTIRDLFLRGKTGRLYKSSKTAAIMSVFRLSSKLEPFIELLVHAANIPMLGNLLENECRYNDEMYVASIVGILGISRSEYKKMFCMGSELFSKGLFRVDARSGNFAMNGKLRQVIISYCETPKAICRVVLGKQMKGILTAKNFAYMKDDYDWIKGMVVNSLKKRQVGINILIDGIPGTGKTEMVKAICREIGVTLYSVSEDGRQDADTMDRRGQLAMSQSLLADDYESVLMVDEAEDVFDSCFESFSSGSRNHQKSGSPSKLVINRLLENNTVPVLWITNNIDGIDPACLRRFTYVHHMTPPDAQGQALIWKKAARRNKFPVSSEMIQQFVKKYDLPPAIIDTALKAAQVMDSSDAIEKTIKSLIAVLPQHLKIQADADLCDYLPALFNTDQKLDKVTEQILAAKNLNFSFCLYGVPGCGKSAYARWLADKLGMKVLQKRASDIMGPYVGMTEARIADAFREAKQRNMLLIFDEADSFLQDRRMARQTWETTCVNEMLTQMESHTLPFCCTTNLMDHLDQASLRRFT